MEAGTATPTTTSTETTAAPSTPVSTGTTATAAPTPAERPKTMAEAFATDATAQIPPSTETGTATTQPAEGTDPLSATNPSTDAKGPIPFEVHQKSLTNARTKAVEEFRQTAGVDKAMEFASKINSNAPGFWREYTSELLAHPQYGPALRSDLARMFGGLRQPAAPAAPEPMPGPDVQIVDDKGQVTGMTYSADQLEKRDAWREKQAQAKSQKAERDRETARAKAQQDAALLNAKADGVMSEIEEILDGNKALMADVNRLMDANPTWTAHKAALEVRKTKIAPALAGKAQADVLESLKTKAAAQAVNPAGAVVATTTRPRSFLDKSLTW